MKFKQYLNEMGMATDFFNSIKNYTSKKAKQFFRDQWLKLEKVIIEQGKEDEFLKIINKNLKTNYKSIDQISKGKIQESYLIEDWNHFWDYLKDNTFPSLSFYPALSIWMELDKIFNGLDVNFTKIGVYAVFFIMIISTSHLKKWYKWKKDNPEEFEKEGKPGPFSFHKKL